GRPRVDARRARPEVLELPAAVVEGGARALRERRVRALHLDRQLLHAHVELAPEELQVRPLRTRMADAHHVAHLLVGQDAEDLRLDEALREALAVPLVASGSPAVAVRASREVEHFANLALEARVGRRAAALVGERRDRDRPALVERADHVLARDLYVVEE